ncbi:MAG: hypothetical protein DCC58_06950 [Chloroflexi bacterium]|nr:MAG: hypothetical protein DCC58_06950 [Chloroflexota bacterium]
MATRAATRSGLGEWAFRGVQVLRAVGLAGLAGFVAGLVAGGIGSRVAMRVVSLTAGHERYGEMTDAEAVVGQITAGGTAFLALFSAFIGMAIGLVYLFNNHWLPQAGARRGLLFGGLLLVTYGTLVIEGDNFDFAEFGSPALNLLMFVALFPLYGLVVVPAFAWLDRHVAVVPPRGLRVMGWVVLALFGLLTLCLGLFLLVAFALGEVGPASLMSLYLVVVAPLLALWLAQRMPEKRAWLLLAFPLTFGSLFLLREVYAIYAA